MKVSIVKIGEPLPGEEIRVRRMTYYARALIAAGEEVEWWTSNWNHHKKKTRDTAELKALAASEKIHLHFIRTPGYNQNVSIGRLAHHYIFAKKLIQELENYPDPDILWVCFPTVPVAVNLIRWATRKQVKIIFDIRDLSPDIFLEHAPSTFKPLINLCLEPTRQSIAKAFSSANGLVAVSQGYLDWGERLALRYQRLPPFRAVLPLGHEMEDLSEKQVLTLKARLIQKGLKEKCCLKVVYAGGFGHSYDILTVLEAAKLSAEQNINVQFLIAGGGAIQDEVTNAAQNCENLLYLGWLDSDELQVLLSLSDIGLMPYSDKATQGFPNKIYEYLAHGLVLVSSLRGESQSFIKDHKLGFIYPPNSAKSLCGLVKNLVENQKIVEEISSNALSVYQKKFNSDRMASKMVEFTESVFRNSFLGH